MANILKENMGFKLLDKKYQYEAGGYGIAKEPLKNFLNKNNFQILDVSNRDLSLNLNFDLNNDIINNLLDVSKDNN